MFWLYMGVAAMLVGGGLLYIDEKLRDRPPRRPDFWEAWFRAPGRPNGRH